ncbi:unnamed protein product [Ilex paraguariensis]|uniref:Uncharacterized protein n=1 Tax=Ilex paraguariensis TaxID=185542 RepID=A0ABC8SPP5_9AQUA
MTESLANNLVPELYLIRFKDLPFTRPSEVVQMFIADVNNIRSSAAIVWNTMDFLEHSSLSQLQQQYQIPNFFIGPMHKIAPISTTSVLKEDNSCLAWLDKQAPNAVIYVSLGSLEMVNEKELAKMTRDWTTVINHSCGLRGPRLVDGSKVSDQCLELFQRFKERIIGRDQKVNARHLIHVWRVGLEIDPVLEREGIQRAIRSLMVEKEGEEMRQRAIDMGQKINGCVQKGGASYNSLNDLEEFI